MKDNKREINWAMYSEEKRELHDYYLSLGYDERTAAVLALFTFGDGGRRGAVRIDRLYEELLGSGSAHGDRICLRLRLLQIRSHRAKRAY